MAYISGDMTNLFNGYVATDFLNLANDVNNVGLANALNMRMPMPPQFYNGLLALESVYPSVKNHAYTTFLEAGTILYTPGNRIQADIDIYDFTPSVTASSWALVLSLKKTASGFYVVDVRIKHYNE